jgi:hypothetical protein
VRISRIIATLYVSAKPPCELGRPGPARLTELLEQAGFHPPRVATTTSVNLILEARR